MKLPTLLLVLAAALAPAAQPDFSKALAEKDPAARYRAALAALRASDTPQASLGHPDRKVAEAAVDVCRERIADHQAQEGDAASLAIAERLLTHATSGKADPDLARRCIHAVAESRHAFGGKVSGAVAKIALEGPAELRVDATEALAELGDGSQAAVLARLAASDDADLSAAAAEGLTRIHGKGVTDAFVAGIADAALPAKARRALLQAASRRGMSAAAGATAAALAEPELRLEAQKAIVRLAGKQDVPALREALAKAKEPATRGVLERLIAKLEKE
ncbi:MAG: hypothetical protein ACK5VI_07165 [Opitutia bacterium]|jgi:hypothetical protein